MRRPICSTCAKTRSICNFPTHRKKPQRRIRKTLQSLPTLLRDHSRIVQLAEVLRWIDSDGPVQENHGVSQHQEHSSGNLVSSQQLNHFREYTNSDLAPQTLCSLDANFISSSVSASYTDDGLSQLLQPLSSFASHEEHQLDMLDMIPTLSASSGDDLGANIEYDLNFLATNPEM
ncbi:hypothetical protein F5884DRAFT_905995 [Xylogone sp. PMI_703]|nr:hypothetical protein F5884DRAFT_905995 [Xylogone sp. PMI_703]